eukprot:8506542-Karenia_brevis.AAC.1
MVLSKLYHKSSNLLFPGLTLPKYESHFRDAVRDLKLADLCVSPHVWRHTGASTDLMKKSRSIKDVKKRGRWASDSSVSRYAKPAILLQQAAKLSVHQQRMCAAASKCFANNLIAHL